VVAVHSIAGSDARDDALGTAAEARQEMQHRSARQDQPVTVQCAAVEIHRVSGRRLPHAAQMGHIVAVVIDDADAPDNVRTHDLLEFLRCLTAVGSNGHDDENVLIRYAAAVEAIHQQWHIFRCPLPQPGHVGDQNADALIGVYPILQRGTADGMRHGGVDQPGHIGFGPDVGGS